MQRQFLWLKAAAVVAAAAGATSAHAQFDLERLSARIGVTRIAPDVDSGDLSTPSLAGTRLGVRPANQVSGGVNYAFTDHLSVDIPLGLPFKFAVTGDGAIAGVGRLGTVKALPMTALAQYRFGTPASVVRPYVGLGATYARFFKGRSTAALSGLTGGTPSSPTMLWLDNAWGASGQLGVQVPIDQRWSVDVSAIYVRLKTTGHLSSGQSIATRLDPLALSASIGYRF